MKRIYNIFCVTLVCSFLLYSCKKDIVVTDIGQDYFPYKVGCYVVYDVDSTYYNNFYSPVLVTNTKFQLKEVIRSIYYDNQNRPTARLERYIKHYDSLVPYNEMAWTLKNVWAENLTISTAEKVEENIRFVRLVFPVMLNQTWNTNAQNYLTAKNFTYTLVDKPATIGGIAFDSVLQTVYTDGGNILTSKQYHSENYARQVGLIYKQVINVQSQPSTTADSTQLQLFYATPILQRITGGYQYTWTVNSYGVE